MVGAARSDQQTIKGEVVHLREKADVAGKRHNHGDQRDRGGDVLPKEKKVQIGEEVHGQAEEDEDDRATDAAADKRMGEYVGDAKQG